MESIRIILASNYELWWEGLLLLMKRTIDFEVLAICYDAIETIDKASYFQPDVILLDEEIKGGDYGEVARHISELHPEIKIIIITKPYKNVDISAGFRARAKAYIDKDLTYPELQSCIQHVTKGGIVILSPLVAKKLLERAASYGASEMYKQFGYDVGLSKREKEVLTLLAQRGNSNREIAEALHISESTVKAHLSSILEKMKVRTRQQAAILARERGIISEAPSLVDQ